MKISSKQTAFQNILYIYIMQYYTYTYTLHLHICDGRDFNPHQ